MPRDSATTFGDHAAQRSVTPSAHGIPAASPGSEPRTGAFGAPIDQADAKIIADYLKKNYGS